MARTQKLNGTDPLKKPVTVGDLKSLVVALKPLIEETLSDQLRPIRRDLERLEGCIRDLQKLTDTALALERQRLAKERDLEHRKFLGAVDLARHADSPSRIGTDPKAIEQAQQVATAFVNGHEREAERSRDMALVDNRAEGRPPLQPGETPAIVDGEVVKSA